MNIKNMYVSKKNAPEELLNNINEGYTNLSKWIISLSAAAIIFSVRLVKPGTTIFWRGELAFGLGVLVISILLGVGYVKLRLDFALRNLEVILDTKKLGYFSKLTQEVDYEYDGKKTKVKDIIQNLTNGISGTEQEMGAINNTLASLYKWQHCLFYLGIILIAIFGVCSI